jgi:hypothetical protein
MRIFALMLVACSSTTTNGMDASTDAGGTDAARDASNDAIQDATTDGCAGMWSKCQNCIANSCSMELVGCTMNMPCKDALSVLANCVNTCGASCKQTFQSASGTMMLAACMSASCATDCP